MREALDNSKKIEHLDEEHGASFRNAFTTWRASSIDEKTYRTSRRVSKNSLAEGASKNRLFYLATPPSLFPVIVKRSG